MPSNPPASPLRIITLTTLAMIAFAGNSLLCRAVLKQIEIDAASFTSIRLLSGVVMLWLLVSFNQSTTTKSGQGNWFSALALFVYAAGFSFAYIALETGAGALILFGSVQATMIASGAIASGVGYALWYAVLPSLKATSASTVQLSVPVIAAVGGILFLNEPVTLRFFIASVALLGGIALVLMRRPAS